MTTTLEITDVTTLVRRLLGIEDAVVLSWHQEPLPWVAIMDAELYRVRGTAIVSRGSGPVDWSFVLKTFKPPPLESSRTKPTSWDYWKREVVAYESDALNALPGGLTAPRFAGVVEGPQGVLLLAMEEIGDAIPDPWSLDLYGRAARTMGRFNAAYLHGLPIPTAEAFRPGGLRSWVDELARIPDENPDFWDRPLVRRAIPDPADARRLFGERHLLLDSLDRIPQTFTHRDLWPANVLVRRVSGAEQFVAIDWILAGAGALGEDVTGMVGPTLWHFLVEPADAGDLETVVLGGYLRGLDDSGWSGDPAVVRFGYFASLALRIGLLNPAWLACWLSTDSDREWAERKFGRSIEAIVDGWSEMERFLLDRADEARGWPHKLPRPDVPLAPALQPAIASRTGMLAWRPSGASGISVT